MALANKQLKELLSIGAYFEALELAEASAERDIVLRVIELQDGYPELFNMLGRAQTALTEKRNEYENAKIALNVIAWRLGRLYGPNLWTLPMNINEGSASLRTILWKRMEARFITNENSFDLRAASYTGKQILVEISDLLKQMYGETPLVAVTSEMMWMRKATATLVRSSCSLCGGTHQIELTGVRAALGILDNGDIRAVYEKRKQGRATLAFLEGKRRQLQELGALEASGDGLDVRKRLGFDFLSRSVGGLDSDNYKYALINAVSHFKLKVPCQRCVLKHSFPIPNGVRKGWLLTDATSSVVRTGHLTFAAKCVCWLRYFGSGPHGFLLVGVVIVIIVFSLSWLNNHGSISRSQAPHSSADTPSAVALGNSSEAAPSATSSPNSDTNALSATQAIQPASSPNSKEGSAPTATKSAPPAPISSAITSPSPAREVTQTDTARPTPVVQRGLIQATPSSNAIPAQPVPTSTPVQTPANSIEVRRAELVTTPELIPETTPSVPGAITEPEVRRALPVSTPPRNSDGALKAAGGESPPESAPTSRADEAPHGVDDTRSLVFAYMLGTQNGKPIALEPYCTERLSTWYDRHDISRAEAEKDIADYYRVWPHQNTHWVESQCVVRNEGNHFVVILPFDWTASNGKRTETGKSVMHAIVEFRKGEYLISSVWNEPVKK